MAFAPTVREASPARELRWLGHLWLPGLVDGEHTFRIEAAGERQVRLTQSEVFRGLLVPLLPAVMYERTRRGFDAMNRARTPRTRPEARRPSGISGWRGCSRRRVLP